MVWRVLLCLAALTAAAHADDKHAVVVLGVVPKDAAPARNEHMKSSPPSNSVDPVKEVKAEAPPPPN